MRWDVMRNVGNRSESFCTYVPTYHRLQSTMRLIFNLGECLHWFPCACFNRFKLEIPWLTATEGTAENFHLLPSTLLKFGHVMTELDIYINSSHWKLNNIAYKWRNIEGQVAHRLQGTWDLKGNNCLGATEALSFQTPCTPCNDSH